MAPWLLPLSFTTLTAGSRGSEGLHAPPGAEWLLNSALAPIHATTALPAESMATWGWTSGSDGLTVTAWPQPEARVNRFAHTVVPIRHTATALPALSMAICGLLGPPLADSASMTSALDQLVEDA